MSFKKQLQDFSNDIEWIEIKGKEYFVVKDKEEFDRVTVFLEREKDEDDYYDIGILWYGDEVEYCANCGEYFLKGFTKQTHWVDYENCEVYCADCVVNDEDIRSEYCTHLINNENEILELEELVPYLKEQGFELIENDTDTLNDRLKTLQLGYDVILDKEWYTAKHKVWVRPTFRTACEELLGELSDEELVSLYNDFAEDNSWERIESASELLDGECECCSIRDILWKYEDIGHCTWCIYGAHGSYEPVEDMDDYFDSSFFEWVKDYGYKVSVDKVKELYREYDGHEI